MRPNIIISVIHHPFIAADSRCFILMKHTRSRNILFAINCFIMIQPLTAIKTLTLHPFPPSSNLLSLTSSCDLISLMKHIHLTQLVLQLDYCNVLDAVHEYLVKRCLTIICTAARVASSHSHFSRISSCLWSTTLATGSSVNLVQGCCSILFNTCLHSAIWTSTIVHIDLAVPSGIT